MVPLKEIGIRKVQSIHVEQHSDRIAKAPEGIIENGIFVFYRRCPSYELTKEIKHRCIGPLSYDR
jgi:hypothetical protein